MLENGIDKHQLFEPDHTTRRRPLHRYPDVPPTQWKLPACVWICLKSFVLIISANFSSTQLILCLSDGASSCRRGNNVWSRPLVTTLYPGCTKQQNSLPFYIYCQNMIVFITCIGLCSFLWVIPGDYCQLCVLPVFCTLSSSLPIVCSSYSTE